MIEHINKDNIFAELRRIFTTIIGKDTKFLWLSAIYGIGVSLLTLAVPVSVQALINSASYTALMEAVLILAALLFFFLSFSSLLRAVQIYIMELFERKIYAKLSSEVVLRMLFSDYQYADQSNRSELANRYFDIISLQKVVPDFIMKMLALILQMIIGFVVVSSYHNTLFLFNIVFIMTIWVIWRYWGYDAVLASLHMSQAKYDTARHIEDIAHAPSFYNSATHSDYAIKKTDTLIGKYLSCREDYFKITFKQKILLLVIYAVANAALLGIGGFLVINNDLSLGQLVAAELILSAIFYQAAQSGSLLVKLYEMCASLEELYRIYLMPLESPSGKLTLMDNKGGRKDEVFDLNYDRVCFVGDHQRDIRLNFKVENGQKIMIECPSPEVQNLFLESISGYRFPRSGRILFGDKDIKDLALRKMRDHIIVLDRPTIVECTIREVLTIRGADITTSQIHDILEILDLLPTIEALPDGLDTCLIMNGLPLSVDQTLRLKLAASILANPKIIILTQFFDTIPKELYDRIFERIHKIDNLILLYFSNRPEDHVFKDRYLLENCRLLQEGSHEA